MSDVRIQDETLEQIMGERFGRYSKSIIQSRALPDIRDGLKPVQRRILFAMNKDGNTYDKGFRKSAKSVGNVMGNFHPHGDSSIYEALVHLSQDWKMREPLVEMHGNNGSMDGDPPAAMRYTEARLSKIAGQMLADINKDTVEMTLNFDDTEKEPVVLPARIPNLLVNGATGISAGYATNIPPHNLGEVFDALIYLLDHPQATLDELMKFIPGPDFPTGGIIQGIAGIKRAYESGHGRIVVRARTKIEPIRGGKQQIIVTEIPYEVNKAQLVKRIDDLRINKKVEGIAEVRDETDRTGLRIAVELKRNANAQGILNYLFKNTDLQINYNFNMVAIDDLRPQRVGMVHILHSYLTFQREIITRRTQFDLQKASARLNIVDGLIKALSMLDDVIHAIRASQNRAAAKQALIDQFAFNADQAEAIVTLQLYRLTNTDVSALQKEHNELKTKIAEFKKILAEPAELSRVLKREMSAIRKEFANPRRTSIEEHVAKLQIDTKVTVASEDVILLVSRAGYIKRSSLRSYKASDLVDNGLREDDFPVLLTKANTLDHLFIFTNKGHLIYRPVHEVTDARWKDAGEHLSQSVGLDEDEEIIAAFTFKDLKQLGQFILATSDGQVKQTAFADYKPGKRYRTHPAVAIKLHDSAHVINVAYYLPDDQQAKSLMVISQNGYAVRFDLSEVPTTGPRTAGVRAIKLKNDDQVANARLVDDDQHLAMITHRGAFKLMRVKEIAVGTRDRRGELILHKLKTHPHKLVDFLAYDQAFDGVVEIITSRPLSIDVAISDHHLGNRLSNGTFVIDTDSQGTPVLIRQKTVDPLTTQRPKHGNQQLNLVDDSKPNKK